MGEYYLKNKMNESAEDMYMKALEKYRFANNARNVIGKMKNNKKLYIPLLYGGFFSLIISKFRYIEFKKLCFILFVCFFLNAQIDEQIKYYGNDFFL